MGVRSQDRQKYVSSYGRVLLPCLVEQGFCLLEGVACRVPQDTQPLLDLSSVYTRPGWVFVGLCNVGW